MKIINHKWLIMNDASRIVDSLCTKHVIYSYKVSVNTVHYYTLVITLRYIPVRIRSKVKKLKAYCSTNYINYM
jgi:hypothetical protein